MKEYMLRLAVIQALNGSPYFFPDYRIEMMDRSSRIAFDNERDRLLQVAEVYGVDYSATKKVEYPYDRA